jgi:phage replication-related protein YjqB (UPF0714/DUF867 family)
VPDKYRTFSELAKNETEGKDFRKCLQGRSGAIAIIAPHGGGIEPGTSEIAEAIAGENFSFYAFEGIKPTNNRDLHLTSTSFDEPGCLALIAPSPLVVAIHDEDSEQEEIVFLGGRDTKMLGRIRVSLEAAGFTVRTHANPNLQGVDQSNICNRGQSKQGVQLELSKGLRRTFFSSLKSSGREKKTDRFNQFVAAMRAALQ